MADGKETEVCEAVRRLALVVGAAGVGVRTASLGPGARKGAQDPFRADTRHLRLVLG